MEKAQAAKKDSRGEKRKERLGRRLLPRNPVVTSETENPLPEGKCCVHPSDGPHHAGLHGCRGEGLIMRPRSWRDTP
ncbi:UNVERIFIED_CONTAM: hypothetical protein Sradi_7259300 [Sesamum radiatum]|uniref:Uncharacterized protein n=1 Tax=Sesamum radiatum TaxID=300843 RepID=A0AAW2IKM2_SESRA